MIRRTLVGAAVAALLLFAGAALAMCLAGSANASTDYASVSFVDATHGWAAGIDAAANTVLCRSTNGGIDWEQIGSLPAAGGGIGWVCFRNPMNGLWGVGQLQYTSDGGGTWNPVTGSGLDLVNKAAFADQSTGWAVCSYGSSESGGAIAKTTDGGASWTVQKSLPGSDGSGGFMAVSCPTVKSCYALKCGKQAGVWATGSRGATWRRHTLPKVRGGSGWSYKSISFPDKRTGWAVGDDGTIVRTMDGGATWKRQSSGTDKTLWAVSFLNANRGMAVGNGGVILRTVDGGKDWNRLHSGVTRSLRDVCLVDPDHAWVVGHKGVRLRTTDGGHTWTGSH